MTRNVGTLERIARLIVGVMILDSMERLNHP